MARKTRAPARQSRAKAKARRSRAVKKTRKRPRGFDSNRARKFGRKIPKQEIPTPRGRPYVPIHRTYTPELLANGRGRYEETPEEVAAIAADFRIQPGSLRRLAGELGWVRFNMAPRELPAASRLLAQTEELERLVSATPTPNPSPQGGGEEIAAPPGHTNIPETFAANLDQLEREVRAQLALVTAARERLHGLPPRPREGEASSRALSNLTAVLQKIHLMRAGLNPSDTENDDDFPADLDAFRDELARRIEAFMASRPDEGDAEQAGGAAPLDQV